MVNDSYNITYECLLQKRGFMGNMIYWYVCEVLFLPFFSLSFLPSSLPTSHFLFFPFFLPSSYSFVFPPFLTPPSIFPYFFLFFLLQSFLPFFLASLTPPRCWVWCAMASSVWCRTTCGSRRTTLSPSIWWERWLSLHRLNTTANDTYVRMYMYMCNLMHKTLQ